MTLADVWFVLVVATLAAYVALDGFDLGAGIVHRLVARAPVERRIVVTSIGPVWDGNEVWLLAAGGTIFLAFPNLYAAALSGFYLPVTILLWLYVFRALGIEMKHHGEHPVWDEVWDTAFMLASLAITFFLGVALGNVVRGVTFDEAGRFFTPLFTTLLPSTSGRAGAFDLYTVLVGATSVAAVTLHGALWLAHRTAGAVADRARALAPRALAATAVLAVAATAFTFVVQPLAGAALRDRPLSLILPALAAASLALAAASIRRGALGRAFGASTAFLVAMIASAAATIHPYLLPGRAPGTGLTAAGAAAADYALGVGLVWWIPGVLLAALYFTRTFRNLPERVRAEDLEGH